MDSLNVNIAITAHYLKAGFDALSKVDHELRDDHSDIHSGDTGITASMVMHAEFIENLVQDKYLEQEPPGVMSYEITEGLLGPWLFANPQQFLTSRVSDAFQRHVKVTLDEWFQITQPAQATNQEESTMTVSELITQLQRLDGALPVLTRGSEAQKMVDAIQVREVKTPTRRAVFIGKPKAVTAD